MFHDNLRKLYQLPLGNVDQLIWKSIFESVAALVTGLNQTLKRLFNLFNSMLSYFLFCLA